MGALCRFALEYRLTVTVFFGGLASTAGAVSTAESEQYVMEPRGYEALYRLHVSSLVNLVKVGPPIQLFWDAHFHLVVCIPFCNVKSSTIHIAEWADGRCHPCMRILSAVGRRLTSAFNIGSNFR